MINIIAHIDHTNKEKPVHFLRGEGGHLESTRYLSSKFAQPFDSFHLTEVSALLHDIGKGTKEFQKYIQQPSTINKVEHAIGGAYVLCNAVTAKKHDLTDVAKLIANAAQLLIAGHHIGLLNYRHDLKDRYMKIPTYLTSLDQYFQTEIDSAIAMLQQIPPTSIQLLENISREEKLKWYLSTLIRLSFSALIDADWLDTEFYFSKEKVKLREYNAPTFATFYVQLDKYVGSLPQNNFSTIKDTIQLQAIQAGLKQYSFFCLHTPTGTGKTIASLYFALSHAKKYDKSRIIIALPMKNLTHQTSMLCKQIFGEEHVIEDHSGNNVLLKDDEESYQQHYLATENWDRKLIVSTTSQLFESLFHNKPTKVRKLHRLANSIIILDEYHTLPLAVLQPILYQLSILQQYFGVTVLLTSATPYALTESNSVILDPLPIEIVKNYEQLYYDLQRVEYHYIPEEKSIVQLANDLAAEKNTVLTIVNTRRDAQKIYLQLKKTTHSFDAIYHLSNSMCGNHIAAVFKRIEKDLKNRKIAVIATSIIEAGIDISFPTVYRMMAPMESIIQAAGRCNRNMIGRFGNVHIFELSEATKMNEVYVQGITLTRNLIRNQGIGSLHDPKWVRYYFKQRLSNESSLDMYDISSQLLQFKDVAQQFRIINDARVSAICTQYEQFNKNLLKPSKPSRQWWRAIQPYTVNIFEHEAEKCAQVHGVPLLKMDYDKELGVLL